MRKTKISVFQLTLGAMIAALYLLLTLPFAQFSFGLVQFRLAEALTLLPALNPIAILGVTLGCLLANLLNPSSLGLVDIILGTLATFLASMLTYYSTKSYRNQLNGLDLASSSAQVKNNQLWCYRILAAFWPIAINALIVGAYLPFLLLTPPYTPVIIITSVATIFLCQAVVIGLIGMPLLLAWERIKILRRS